MAQRLHQIQEDMKTEWWRAGETDDFSLKNKMARVGCRPLKRKHLACRAALEHGDQSKYEECHRIRQDMDECYKALSYMQIASHKFHNDDQK